MYSTFILSFWLLFICGCADGQLFDPKLRKGDRGNPGVKGRLTDKGFKYMGNILGNIFADAIPQSRVPDVAQILPNNRGVVRLRNIRIEEFLKPRLYRMSAKEPNQIQFQLIGMEVNSIGDLAGSVNIIRQISLEGQLKIRASQINVQVAIDMDVTTNGLPSVQLAHCGAQIGPISIFNLNGGLGGAALNIFRVCLLGIFYVLCAVEWKIYV